MKAENAIEGHLYHLKEKAAYKEEKRAECIGFSWDKSFMRFLTFDEYGTRKIRMVLLHEDIEQV